MALRPRLTTGVPLSRRSLTYALLTLITGYFIESLCPSSVMSKYAVLELHQVTRERVLQISKAHTKSFSRFRMLFPRLKPDVILHTF